MARPNPKETKAPKETEEKLTPKGEKAPAEGGEKRKVGTRGSTKFKGAQIVTLLVDYNPKRAGSSSHKRFEAYEDGMTVDEAQKAGITAGDLLWDTKHGFIEIGDAYNKNAVVKSKPEPKPKAEKTEKVKDGGKGKAKAKPADEDEDEDE